MGFGAFALVGKPVNAPSDISSSLSPSPTQVPKKSAQIIDFEKDGVAFQAAWLKITRLNNLFLYPNFEERIRAEELFKQKSCRSIVSAGFYTKENTPVGLFTTEGEQIKNRVDSRLFDGIFSVDKSGSALISLETPQNVRLALQSGPILIKNEQVQKLQIKDDKSARRVVLTLNKNSEVYFLAIFNKESVFEGPLLAELPQIIKGLEGKMGVKFLDAINLDGGSASAFYSDFLSLPELSPIGGYFCLK